MICHLLWSLRQRSEPWCVSGRHAGKRRRSNWRICQLRFPFSFGGLSGLGFRLLAISSVGSPAGCLSSPWRFGPWWRSLLLPLLILPICFGLPSSSVRPLDLSLCIVRPKGWVRTKMPGFATNPAVLMCFSTHLHASSTSPSLHWCIHFAGDEGQGNLISWMVLTQTGNCFVKLLLAQIQLSCFEQVQRLSGSGPCTAKSSPLSLRSRNVQKGNCRGSAM